MKNTDPLIGEKLKPRHIYKICFLIFLAVFARLASKFSKSANMTKFFGKKSKKISKTHNFALILNSLKKLLKSAPKKSYKQNKFDEHE
jgi:hypothetical protein